MFWTGTSAAFISITRPLPGSWRLATMLLAAQTKTLMLQSRARFDIFDVWISFAVELDKCAGCFMLRAKSGEEKLKADGLEWLSVPHKNTLSRKSSFLFKICLITTVTYGSFWWLIHQTIAPTFVIKQEKLLHRVNIGGLIERDSVAVENCMVNHSIPALLYEVFHRYWQIMTVIFYFYFSFFQPSFKFWWMFFFILLNLPFLCFAALVFTKKSLFVSELCPSTFHTVDIGRLILYTATHWPGIVSTWKSCQQITLKYKLKFSANF